ncbi:hypothetical protein SBD_4607 [Streptomyces bottropensis ATCC 25435]|uniref:Uncharacterized protein n=1 Tax=Streptomyces bottropensis ATCC 25435 TaxID=1054862 RepID=M3F0C2_9ACTN|nr:hypothetical protein SBD_4607 [Streptomyces bottropensis ATCC 25435]
MDTAQVRSEVVVGGGRRFSVVLGFVGLGHGAPCRELDG